MKKSAIIVSLFDNYSYPVRTRFIESYLINSGYSVNIVAGDYDHRNKRPYHAERRGLSLVHVLPYKKNMSLSRLISHWGFSRKVLKIIKCENPDLIYICTPPNSLFGIARKSKLINQNALIVIDVIDMWPESLPLSAGIKFILNPALELWKMSRDRNIAYADRVIHECDLFNDYLNKRIRSVPSITIYLSKPDIECKRVYCNEDINNKLSFLYLGSLNNIFDSELTSKLLNELARFKKVELHIIGDGESKERFLSLLNNVTVYDHGIVYDQKEKENIFCQCQFALNIMKTMVFVGLTMKSIDYFAAGLPIVNNISGDTKDIVEKNECGININSVTESLITDILHYSNDDIRRMGNNAYNFYRERIAEREIYRQLDSFLSLNDE